MAYCYGRTLGSWGGVAVVDDTGSVGQFIVRAMHITPLSFFPCIVASLVMVKRCYAFRPLDKKVVQPAPIPRASQP